MVKVAGAISQSGEVMKSMNNLMNVGAMRDGMQVRATPPRSPSHSERPTSSNSH